MKKILVTGGTVFVSRYVAEYFTDAGYEVYVLNRNTREQPQGVILIEADRYALGDVLKPYHFDCVIDVAAYTEEDIELLLAALGEYEDYIFVSSSAVYPETCPQPFTEESVIGENKFWGKYGTDKIAAETILLCKNPKAYVLRPPYLYGPMNNVYREAFVFDCALQEREFFLPGEGELQLQFFHVKDLCRVMEQIVLSKPDEHIFNVGNEKTISVREWVSLCYEAAGKSPRFVNVWGATEQRRYFPFYRYEYRLDVSRQKGLLSKETSMEEGLREAYEWYRGNEAAVNKKPLLQYIDDNRKDLSLQNR